MESNFKPKVSHATESSSELPGLRIGPQPNEASLYSVFSNEGMLFMEVSLRHQVLNLFPISRINEDSDASL